MVLLRGEPTMMLHQERTKMMMMLLLCFVDVEEVDKEWFVVDEEYYYWMLLMLSLLLCCCCYYYCYYYYYYYWTLMELWMRRVLVVLVEDRLDAFLTVVRNEATLSVLSRPQERCAVFGASKAYVVSCHLHQTVQ